MPVEVFQPAVPAALSHLLSAMLAKAASHRPTSAQVIDRLTALS
jgi:hypothetical protein